MLRSPPFPRRPLETPSFIHPAEEPEPQGRVKSHCLRPLPPPDPAPAGPLPGIWLGGGGGFQPGNRPEARLPSSTPGGLPHLSPSPLLPPTAAWENSCFPFHTSRSAPSGRLEFCCSAGTEVGTLSPPGARTSVGAFQAGAGAGQGEEGR